MNPVSDRLPLVIGVTGHRDLREHDVARLEQAVAAILAALRRDYLGDRKETPIVVVSALAEGADRLVARVAMAQGARLVAPLPMPLEEYRRDFVPGLRPGNIVEFDELLSRAIAAPVMPLRGTSLQELRTDRAKRAEQYRAVGMFIIQRCHVLLALWDGNDAEKAAGGSAEVVAFKRDGIPLAISGSARAGLDDAEVGPVIEIITPRMKESSSVSEVTVRPWGPDVVGRHRGVSARRSLPRIIAQIFGHRHESEPVGLTAEERRELETWERFETLIGLTCRFNREAAALATAPDGPDRLQQSIDYLFADPERGTLDPAARGHALSTAPLWCGIYALADTLALIRQKQFTWDWKLLFSLGFVAFLCFAMFTHIGHVHKEYFIVAYIVSFIIIFALFVRAMLGQHQERYLDYRALGEALRIAIYWKLIGIGTQHADAKTGAGESGRAHDEALGGAADAYPIEQPSELAWVKICLRTSEWLDRGRDAATGALDSTGHAIARRFWVLGQHVYFRRQQLRHNSFASAIEACSIALLVLSPFVFAPLLLADMMRHWLGAGAQHAFIIVIGLLPGLAAAFAGYSERLAFKAKARQYDRMRILFKRAYDLLPENISNDTRRLAHMVYYELGIETMRENAEWVAIYRQRPIQPTQS